MVEGTQQGGFPLEVPGIISLATGTERTEAMERSDPALSDRFTRVEEAATRLYVQGHYRRALALFRRIRRYRPDIQA